LRDVQFRPYRLNDLGDFPGGALDGDDVAPGDIRQSGLTGAGRLTIDMDRARAAKGLTTSVFRAEQLQIVSKNPKQRLVRINVDLFRLTIERNLHSKPLP